MTYAAIAVSAAPLVPHYKPVIRVVRFTQFVIASIRIVHIASAITVSAHSDTSQNEDVVDDTISIAILVVTIPGIVIPYVVIHIAMQMLLIA